MRCKNCKHKTSKTEKYCPNCGCEIITKSNENKRKNKKILIVLVSIFLVVFIACGGLLTYHFIQMNRDAKTEVTTTVTSFFDAYCSKSGDANNYLTFTSVDNTPITYEGYQGYCAEKISYKIIDVSKIDRDSELITVTVEIQNIDLNAVLNKLNEKSFDNDEEIIEYFYSLIQSADVPTHTYKCNINCKQYPTGMKILFDAELSNALLGGYSAFVVGNNE